MGLVILLGLFAIYVLGCAVSCYFVARVGVEDNLAGAVVLGWPIALCIVPFVWLAELGKKHRK